MTEIQNPTEEPVVEPAITETTAQPVAEEPVVSEAPVAEEPQAEISSTSVQYQNTKEVLDRLKQIAETGEETSRHYPASRTTRNYHPASYSGSRSRCEDISVRLLHRLHSQIFPCSPP